jgi:uncharacterized membrane protein
MRALTLALGMVGLLGLSIEWPTQAQIQIPGTVPGPGATPGPGPSGGVPPGMFKYTICNASKSTNAFAAIAARMEPAKWSVAGWMKIPDKGCAFMGVFLKDTVYLLALADNGDTWSGTEGKDPALCATLQQFQYTTGDGGKDPHSCNAANGEKPTPFRTVKIDANVNDFSSNLND